MKIWKRIVLVGVAFVALDLAVAQTPVRIATFNIKYLSTNVSNQGDRLQKLKKVIQLLQADIIALQEIKDRAALEVVFPTNLWHLVIVDDSGDNQDAAIAVRKTLQLPDFTSDLDADDDDFLGSGESDTYFPKRRDVLVVRVKNPAEDTEFYVMVVHAKSRSDGRATSEHRRVGAARILIQKLKANYANKPFVLLGDFNDNPDDQSLNILETGDPNAPAGPEEIPGLLLVNLTEPLCAAGHVSHGPKRLLFVRPKEIIGW
jgi:predicted extracellular nuclease